MKINRKDLLDALNKVKVGLSDKAIIDQTDHFIFDSGCVRTYNDQIAVSYPFKMEEMKVAIRADEFLSLINKIDKEEIEILLSDNELELSAGRTKAKVVIDPEIKCPVIDDIGEEWKPVPENFSEGLAFCSFSADKNMLLPELTCLWIVKEFILSSDNWRATKFQMKSAIEDSFLLPATCAERLAKYSPIEYSLGQSWIHFRNQEEIIFSCRIVAGNYPEAIWDLFQMQGEDLLLPEGLGNSIDRAKIFVGGHQGSDLIVLSVNAGKMICKGEGPFGWVQEEHIVRCRKNFEVKVSPQALLEILPRVSRVTVADKLFFKGDNFEHVVCVG